MKPIGNMEECLRLCKEFDFNDQITKECLWNEGYRLGRSRWYWGPSWFVSFIGWLNTQKQRLCPLQTSENETPTNNKNQNTKTNE